MFDTYGSLAVVPHVVGVLRGSDLVTEQGIRAVRQVVLPLWNACCFFSLYANAEQYEARFRSDAEGTLDRYLWPRCTTSLLMQPPR
jgi:isoleucyl-tRNA synthetase